MTGSTSGIGLGVARTLATYGAAELLNGFGSKAAIDTAIADVAARGTTVAYSAADMSKPGEIAAMASDALSRPLGLATLCMGGGQGIAMIVDREP